DAGTVLVALDISVEEADLKAQEAQAALAETTLVAQSDRAQRDDRPDRRRRLAVLEGLRDGDRHRLDRFGLVRRRRAGFLPGRILPRGEGTPGSDERREQQNGSDPATTTHERCPPTRLAVRTLVLGNVVLGSVRAGCERLSISSSAIRTRTTTS